MINNCHGTDNGMTCTKIYFNISCSTSRLCRHYANIYFSSDYPTGNMPSHTHTVLAQLFNSQTFQIDFLRQFVIVRVSFFRVSIALLFKPSRFSLETLCDASIAFKLVLFSTNRKALCWTYFICTLTVSSSMFDPRVIIYTLFLKVLNVFSVCLAVAQVQQIIKQNWYYKIATYTSSEDLFVLRRCKNPR